MKYVALLRGVNVGGKNKISMTDLKICFEELGFKNVITYINSGNIIFDSEENNITKLIKMCEEAISKQFDLKIVCNVISAQNVIEAINQAPGWWGVGKSSKHNAIFIIPPASAQSIINEIGEIKPEYERVEIVGSIILWSAPIKTFSKTRYTKIVGTKAYKSVTIRNSNTVTKLIELCNS